MEVVEWSRKSAEARRQGQPAPAPPSTGGVYNSAAQLDSRESGGPVVNLLTRDQSVTWFFKTREGRMGILQLVSFPDNQRMAKIRYKLLQSGNGDDAAGTIEANKTKRETLKGAFGSGVQHQ